MLLEKEIETLQHIRENDFALSPFKTLMGNHGNDNTGRG